MIRSISVADLADAVLPDWCRHKAIAVLRAYFDESGIHAGSPVTTISGFIGSRGEWRAVGRKWREAMGDRVFHYKNMRMEGELLDRLSTILCESKLAVVSAAFSGDWERAIHSGAADWPTRFPSAYSMVLEFCVQQMERYSAQNWNNEPTAIWFSRQDAYAKRAEEVWRTYKGNGQWGHIVSFAYGDPEMAELQAADMIAYETFQCLRQGGEEAWNKWPLVRKLLSADREMFGRHQTEKSFVEMMRAQDVNRRYLQIVEKPKKN